MWPNPRRFLRNGFNQIRHEVISPLEYALIDDAYYFFLEINGNQVFPINGVEDLERLVSEKTGQPVQFHVMSNIATVATSKGYESYRNFSRRILEKLKPKLKKDMKEIIENSNL